MIYDIANICSVISRRRVGENLLFGVIVNVENVDRGLCSLAHIVTQKMDERFLVHLERLILIAIAKVVKHHLN